MSFWTQAYSSCRGLGTEHFVPARDGHICASIAVRFQNGSTIERVAEVGLAAPDRIGLVPGMTIKKALLGTAVLTGSALWVGRGILTRRLTKGDSESDEFSLAAVIGGAERASTATALRRGRVIAACGGVELDLRGAKLDPAGAELLVEAYLGGVQVRVPNEWRIAVEAHSTSGGVETNVAQPDDLPDDAPNLRVEAIARLGGVMITAETDE